jgi:hypothetical protein
MALDISDPTKPLLLDSLEFEPKLLDMEHKYGRMWLMQGNSLTGQAVIHVVDIRYPKAMRTLGRGVLYGVDSGQVRLYEALAYSASLDPYLLSGPMKIYATDWPTAPRYLVDVIGIPAFKAWIDGDLAYISTGRVDRGSRFYNLVSSSIAVVDISIAEEPEGIGFIYTPGLGQVLEVRDEMVFIAGTRMASDNRNIWIEAADISDPGNPTLIYTMNLGGFNAFDIAASDLYVYLAAGESGVYILRPEVGQKHNQLTLSDFQAEDKIWLDFWD